MGKKSAIVAFLLAVVATAVYWTCIYDDFEPSAVRGKRVLITGASSGIGRQLAYEYSRLGARVVVTARREKELKEVVAKCHQLGAEQADYVLVDFAKPEDRARCVKQTEVLLGGLDHLILNHINYRYGFWVGTEQNLTDLQSDLNVNFVSYADIAFKALPALSKSSGSIGIVSGIDIKFAVPKCGTHAVSKMALDGLFRNMYYDMRLLSTGVSVTTAVLGPIATYFKREDVYYFGIRAAALDETAVAIIAGVTTRAREIYHPVSVSIALFLQRFFKTWVEEYSYSCFLKMLNKH